MIDARQIGEIIAVYEKHAWQLRRILLTAALKECLGNSITHLVDGVQVMDADIDAAWFSRPPRAGGVAWEIRHLSETPYALLENIDENSLGFEDELRRVETRLRENIGKAKSA
jgi:hypothetical protein